jgi:hypothetical protein
MGSAWLRHSPRNHGATIPLHERRNQAQPRRNHPQPRRNHCATIGKDQGATAQPAAYKAAGAVARPEVKEREKVVCLSGNNNSVAANGGKGILVACAGPSGTRAPSGLRPRAGYP